MRKRVEVLGVNIDAVDLEGAAGRVSGFIRHGGRCHVVTANAEILYAAQIDPGLRTVLNRASLVTADGTGVIWAARRLGYTLPGRVAGIDLLVELLGRAAKGGWTVYFYGGSPGVAGDAAEKIKKRFPGIKILGTSHGFLTSKEHETLLQDLEVLHPDFLVVALGAPRQEFWLAEHLSRLPVKVGIGVGGSLDVLSGRVKRAPRWVQGMHLEWLYRIILNPSRLPRALSLPRFAWLVLRQR